MATNRDLFNLMGALSQSTVDAANREFYGRITYPWPQLTYWTYADQHCGTVFLNQELGDWTHTRVPPNPRIWILTTAYQKAMRYLFIDDPEIELDEQLALTANLIDRFPFDNTMCFYLKQQKEESREFLADTFLQPVEHSYTVESLIALLETAGLELGLPCLSVVDKAAGKLSWNVEFDNQMAASHYEKLPDVARWQISNLLMVERSPLLLFYVQRNDSRFKRKSEREVCDEFLDLKFVRYSTTTTNYVDSGNGSYKLSPAPLPHPSPRVPIDQIARGIFKEVSPERTFNLVNNVRIQLTTALFSYLKAV